MCLFVWVCDGGSANTHRWPTRECFRPPVLGRVSGWRACRVGGESAFLSFPLAAASCDLDKTELSQRVGAPEFSATGPNP